MMGMVNMRPGMDGVRFFDFLVFFPFMAGWLDCFRSRRFFFICSRYLADLVLWYWEGVSSGASVAWLIWFFGIGKE